MFHCADISRQVLCWKNKKCCNIYFGKVKNLWIQTNFANIIGENGIYTNSDLFCWEHLYVHKNANNDTKTQAGSQACKSMVWTLRLQTGLRSWKSFWHVQKIYIQSYTSKFWTMDMPCLEHASLPFVHFYTRPLLTWKSQRTHNLFIFIYLFT